MRDRLHTVPYSLVYHKTFLFCSNVYSILASVHNPHHKMSFPTLCFGCVCPGTKTITGISVPLNLSGPSGVCSLCLLFLTLHLYKGNAEMRYQGASPFCVATGSKRNSFTLSSSNSKHIHSQPLPPIVSKQCYEIKMCFWRNSPWPFRNEELQVHEAQLLSFSLFLPCNCVHRHWYFPSICKETCMQSTFYIEIIDGYHRKYNFF